MPVFSIEWLLMNNLDYLNTSKLVNVSDKIKVIQVLNFQFKAVLNEYIKEEIKNRSYVENYKGTKKMTLLLDKKINYEKFECDLCTSYGYFSFYECDNCDFEGCLEHFPNCKSKCEKSNFLIYYRYETAVFINIFT